MASLSIRIAALLLAIVLFETSFSAVPRQLKCGKNDPRQIYPYCMYGSRSKTIWCDQSNYTQMPHISEINSHLYDVDCTKAKALFVNDSCLTEINKRDLESYEELRIFLGGQNYISVIRNWTFRGNLNLNEIDLSDNDIETLEERALAGLLHLRRLRLDNNRISHIHHRLLKDLHHLEHLSIGYNFLEEIDDLTFERQRNLKTLNLKGNSIDKIDDFAFVKTKNLQELHLDGNQIEAITADTFQGLHRLEILTISHNRIAQWPEKYGTVLINLHTLHLGNNQLEAFSPSHLARMSKLQNLLLDNNSLSTIHEDLFLSTPLLTLLNLSTNHLQDIPEGSFKTLCHLESLILTKNNLTTPREGWFTHLVNKSLENSHTAISENKWSCNCNVRKYKKFHDGLRRRRDEASRILTKKLEITCQQPQFTSRRALDKDLTAEIEFRLGCQTKEEKESEGHGTAVKASACEATVPFNRERFDAGSQYFPHERRAITPIERMWDSQELKGSEDITSNGALVGVIVTVIIFVVFVIALLGFYGHYHRIQLAM